MIPYYSADIRKTKCLGHISLEKFLYTIKNPKKGLIELFERIHKATEEGNKDLKAELKKQLYSFTPCVEIDKGSRRMLINVKGFTGLAVVEFDKIDNAKEFKEYVFNKYKFIITAFISPSGKGVKTLIRIPIVKNREEFRRRYIALKQIFYKYEGFDPTGINCVLPLFLSWDKDLLYRKDSELFTEIGEEEEKYYDDFDIGSLKNSVIDSDEKKRVIDETLHSFSKIIDGGRRKVFAIGVYLGECVRKEYIGLQEARTLLLKCINNMDTTSYYKNNYREGVNESLKRGILKKTEEVTYTRCVNKDCIKKCRKYVEVEAGTVIDGINYKKFNCYEQRNNIRTVSN